MTKKKERSGQLKTIDSKGKEKSREEMLRDILESQQGSQFLRRPAKEPVDYVRTKLRAGLAG